MDYTGMGLTMVKTLGLMLGMLALMVLGLIMFIDLWAKKVTQDPEKGRIIGIFDDDGRIHSKMLRLDNGKAYLGKGDKKEEYLIDIKKLRIVSWPAGLPWMLQIPVRAHYYIRNQPEPCDLKNPTATITSRARMMISDEAMLKTAWRDAKDAAQGPTPVAKHSSVGMMITFATLAVSGLGVYFILKVQSAVQIITKMLGG